LKIKPNIEWLYIFIPISIISHFTHQNEAALFVFSCLAIVPLADVMGKATEVIADKFGPAIGGFLNATFGNAAELIIAMIALSKGFVDVVKASITGSIVGNLLLVVGLSMTAGGMKYKSQTFSKTHSNAGATALIIASLALFIQTVYHYAAEHSHGGWSIAVQQKVSIGISFIILITYFCQLLFSLKTHRSVVSIQKEETDEPLHRWSMKKSTVILFVSTVFIAILSEYMVNSIEAVKQAFGFSEIFIGVIIVAIIGNAAEHSSAVLMAMKNKMDLALEIAIGSSLQVALFLSPVLVFASYFFANPMTLEFSIPEVVAVMAAVWITAHVVSDGESNWVEGTQMLCLYFILAVLFYYLPDR